jgi:hypothetical protein
MQRARSSMPFRDVASKSEAGEAKARDCINHENRVIFMQIAI